MDVFHLVVGISPKQNGQYHACQGHGTAIEFLTGDDFSKENVAQHSGDGGIHRDDQLRAPRAAAAQAREHGKIGSDDADETGDDKGGPL